MAPTTSRAIAALVAVAFGIIGGPLAYWGASRGFNAVVFSMRAQATLTQQRQCPDQRQVVFLSCETGHHQDLRRALLERMRAAPFVLVTGDSGVGKSSLCRAGVLPAVLEGALGRDDGDGPSPRARTGRARLTMRSAR